ncbi:MAG: hypothetical protein AB7K24_13385 [Gemmataceae bacterium]
MSAIDTQGKTIPMDFEHDLPSETIALHGLGSGVSTRGGIERRHIDYFLGTEAELRQYLAR